MSKHKLPSSLEETAAYMNDLLGATFYDFKHHPADEYGREYVSIIVKYDNWNYKVMGLWHETPARIWESEFIDVVLVQFQGVKFHFAKNKPELVFSVQS